MTSKQAQTVELSVSERGELRLLRTWLKSHSTVDVSDVGGDPSAGRLGSMDVLLVTATSGSVMTAIRTLPYFIRSRKSHTSITVKTKKKEVTFTSDNAEESMHILEKLLDD